MRAPLAALLALSPAPIAAQAYHCTPPEPIARPHLEGPTSAEPRRMLPIGGYTLALHWSPQLCRQPGADDDLRCRRGNRFGFTLHGLWADGVGKSWPQYCAPAPLLSDAVVRANICVIPSAQLLQHEYAKHGTCTGRAPADYFAVSAGLYRKLHYPDMDGLMRRGWMMAGQFAAAFARANPGLEPEMIRLTADRQDWLQEVWICLDTKLRYRRCPAQQGVLSRTHMIRVFSAGRS